MGTFSSRTIWLSADESKSKSVTQWGSYHWWKWAMVTGCGCQKSLTLFVEWGLPWQWEGIVIKRQSFEPGWIKKKPWMKIKLGLQGCHTEEIFSLNIISLNWTKRNGNNWCGSAAFLFYELFLINKWPGSAAAASLSPSAGVLFACIYQIQYQHRLSYIHVVVCRENSPDA